jgi:hypothetical protein
MKIQPSVVTMPMVQRTQPELKAARPSVWTTGPSRRQMTLPGARAGAPGGQPVGFGSGTNVAL